MKAIEDSVVEAVAHHRTIGSTWPYSGGGDADIKEYFEAVAKRIDDTGKLKAIRAFDYPGTTNLSFGKILCPKADGSSTYRVSDGNVIAGIVIYLCRYAPLAVWGCGTRNELPTGGFDAECSWELVYTPPKMGNWDWESAEVEAVLAHMKFQLPSKEDLGRRTASPLPFRSAMSNGTDRVFDALFHVVYE